MRKLDQIKSREGKQEIKTTIHVDQSDQVKAIGNVQIAIEKLYSLLNEQKQSVDMSVLEKQLTVLNEKLDFSSDFTLLRDTVRKSKVDSVSIKDFNQLLKAVESNKPLPVNIDFSSLEKAIIQVEQRIQESLVTSNAPENYSPIRRVIKVGTRLIYDDNPTTTGGRGGSGGGNLYFLENGEAVQVSTENPLPVDASLEVGDIQIGAVEIKNSTDDTRATVGPNGLYVDVRSQNTPTTTYNGTLTVPTGTSAAIASSQTIQSVTVKSLSTNTAAIYVGATGTTVANG